MKTFIWTFVAVFVGIYAFTKLSAAKKAAASGAATNTSAAAFEGPDVDPVSGAYLPPGNAVGTVQMASSPNDLTWNMATNGPNKL